MVQFLRNKSEFGEMSMKKLIILTICLILVVSLTACSIGEDTPKDYFGFCKEDFTILDEVDTHGGFHGDGSYYLILDCSKNKEKATEILSEWIELPISENLELIMYGGEKDGISYGYNLAKEAEIPEIENGYYYFCDRHPESTDSKDTSALFDRGSFNFSFAIYDSDTDKMYYFEFDT